MASQTCIIGKNTIITDHTIMGNMDIDHKQIAIANFGEAVILDCTAMNRTVSRMTLLSPISKNVRSPLIFFILAIFTNVAN
jgi:hypothetical protein